MGAGTPGMAVNYLIIMGILCTIFGILLATRKFRMRSKPSAPQLLLGQGAAEATQPPTVEAVSAEPESAASTAIGQMKAHIAAIVAAVHEFTGLPVGAIQITNIEALDSASTALADLVAAPPAKAQIAAITAALYEFLAVSPTAPVRITSIKPIRTVSAWKMAGRLELMGMDVNPGERLER